ncbi:predicted protein [Scheffersomyces stipitis CBS 6054]|uniref:Uncharacterized protein n=1 Tax=Scheffersomyces stipitis (strain ATCC 58785 / CBS 6054 / NBRC 10063 / NRRL Y-11545) TaxID=322104 RepID=A3LNR9_PICST|nr:predicted protein [Scheffersomyces stipitis CBS 6054]ABN64910.2 predicted protein [Scheffersomyces stipitis CBS 6054]
MRREKATWEALLKHPLYTCLSDIPPDLDQFTWDEIDFVLATLDRVIGPIARLPVPSKHLPVYLQFCDGWNEICEQSRELYLVHDMHTENEELKSLNTGDFDESEKRIYGTINKNVTLWLRFHLNLDESYKNVYECIKFATQKAEIEDRRIKNNMSLEDDRNGFRLEELAQFLQVSVKMEAWIYSLPKITYEDEYTTNNYDIDYSLSYMAWKQLCEQCPILDKLCLIDCHNVEIRTKTRESVTEREFYMMKRISEKVIHVLKMRLGLDKFCDTIYECIKFIKDRVDGSCKYQQIELPEELSDQISAQQRHYIRHMVIYTNEFLDKLPDITPESQEYVPLLQGWTYLCERNPTLYTMVGMNSEDDRLKKIANGILSGKDLEILKTIDAILARDFQKKLGLDLKFKNLFECQQYLEEKCSEKLIEQKKELNTGTQKQIKEARPMIKEIFESKDVSTL